MRTGIEAAEYGAEVQRLVRYLGVGNGNMQEGSLRCDVNVSVRPIGQSEFGTKVIIKTLLSQLFFFFEELPADSILICSTSTTFASRCYDMIVHQYTNLCQRHTLVH
jgi:hypothetical protein